MSYTGYEKFDRIELYINVSRKDKLQNKNIN